MRSGSLDDPLDMQQQSLSPSYYTDVQRVDATYDEAGAVHLAVTFFQAENNYHVTARLRTRCEIDGEDTAPPVRNEAPELTLDLDWEPYFQGASARLQGFQGASGAEPQLSDDGRTLSATFNHPEFANRDWRCVDGAGGPGYGGRSDNFGFWFTGYAPQPLTPTTAQRAFADALARRFGSEFQAADQSWVKCPREQIFDLDEDGYDDAICMAVFGTGRTRRYATGTVNSAFDAEVGYTRRWIRQMRRCASRYARNIGGTVWTNDGSCGTAGQLASDLAYRMRRGTIGRRATVFWHGTNTAGFGELVKLPCTVRRTRSTYTASCRNKLGDALRYRRTR